jgi:hypothetical protein
VSVSSLDRFWCPEAMDCTDVPRWRYGYSWQTRILYLWIRQVANPQIRTVFSKYKSSFGLKHVSGGRSSSELDMVRRGKLTSISGMMRINLFCTLIRPEIPTVNLNTVNKATRCRSTQSSLTFSTTFPCPIPEATTRSMKSASNLHPP